MLVVLGFRTSLKDTRSDANLMDAEVVAQRQMHPSFGVKIVAHPNIKKKSFMQKLFHLMFSLSHIRSI